MFLKLFPAKYAKNVRFNEQIYRGEDTLFVFEALMNCKSIYFDNKPLYHHVQSEESATRGAFRESQHSVTKLLDIYEPQLEKVNKELIIPLRQRFLSIYISIYADMYFDSKDWTKQQKNLKKKFDELCKKSYVCTIVSNKEKIKAILFKKSPTLFCKYHYFTLKKHGLI